MKSSSRYPMVSMQEALALVKRAATEMPCETIFLKEAGGRYAAETVTASEPFPPFRASVKDGYAVRSSDGVGEYIIAFAVQAGPDKMETLKTGTVAYITTGTPLPEGADAVIQVEDTELIPAPGRRVELTSRGPIPAAGDKVRILVARQPGHDVRPIGCDIAQGSVLVDKNERITAVHMGLLATFNQAQINVFRRPKVTVFSTGDEVVDLGSSNFAKGQIVDSNRPMILDLVKSWGGIAVDGGVLTDQDGLLRQHILPVFNESDIVITSGGVSMGSHDLIKPLLESIECEIGFGRIMMKPGKPTTFAVISRHSAVNERHQTCLFFGLPGNPVSCAVTFELFVRSAILLMLGSARDYNLPRVKAKLRGSNIKMDPERPEYHRATVMYDEAEGLVCLSTGAQASSRLLSVRTANALLEIPRGQGTIVEGSEISAVLLSAPAASSGHFDVAEL